MIKKLIDRLFGKGSAAATVAEVTPAVVEPPVGQRVEVPRDQHRIDRARVDDRAIRVVETLQDAGYEAYIVGGAVRDLLLGLRPKDFDVATNATPSRSRGCSGAPSSSAVVFGSCTWCTVAVATTR